MDEERSMAVPQQAMVPLGALLVGVVLFLIWRMRRPSRDERALAPIVNAINEADIPDGARDILLQSVN
jgi:hypothetical protein